MLKIESLYFQYDSYPDLPGRELFKGLSLILPKGKMGLLQGDSESGKSTLAGIIARLFPEYGAGVLKGRILWNGRELTSMAANDLLSLVGMVFQDPEQQVITTSCRDEMVFALEALGLSREEIDIRMDRELRRMSIAHLIDRNPSSLSGGEKKRLMIAILLACDPELYLLDETLEELDFFSKTELLKLLQALGKTVLFLSSKADPAYSRYFDYQWSLQDGKAVPVQSDQSDGPGSADSNSSTPDKTPESSKDRSSFGGSQLGVKDLRFSYGEGSFQLNAPRFELCSGEVVGLIGPNGSGKSTFARLLCGLAAPGQGQIICGGQTAHSSILNRSGGYLFQNPDYQIFMPTIGEELSLSLEGVSRKEKKEQISQLIQKFRLPGAHTPSALMSYSGRKRLQYACYAPLAKTFLILDEADSGLGEEEFSLFLNQLKTEKNGIIVISHNLPFIENLADRFYCFNKGILQETVPGDSIWESQLEGGEF